MHGFDNDNKEILEKCEVEHATTKLIAIDRIKSICKDLVLIDYPAFLGSSREFL